MKIKKIACILFTILLAGILSSCRLIDDIAEDMENSQSNLGGEMGLELIRCFNEQDTEAFKELFCNTIKRTHDLDSEIAVAYEIIDKPIISYEPFLIGGEQEREHGEVTYSRICVQIDDVVLSENEKYDIVFAAYLVGKNENMIGMMAVDIYSLDGNGMHDKEICNIGEWIKHST